MSDLVPVPRSQVYTAIGLAVLIVGALFMFGFVIGKGCSNGGYRQGQIDALTGTVRFHRVPHPDSTVTWEEAIEP